jgi:hypothetical protein
MKYKYYSIPCYNLRNQTGISIIGREQVKIKRKLQIKYFFIIIHIQYKFIYNLLFFFFLRRKSILLFIFLKILLFFYYLIIHIIVASILCY